MTAPTHRNVHFPSGDGRCAADLWLPEQAAPSPAPIVILGHGLGATRAMGLAAYARRFTAAGLATLSFDYRHFGDSEGEPRELISIPRQLEDWAAAVTFARSLSEVDATRVAVWGTSFGGGHVLHLAAHDHSLAAVVAQCPFTDGIASSLTLGPRSSVRVSLTAIADQLGAWLGRRPLRVAGAGRRGDAALMTAPDALAGYERLAVEAGVANTRPAARIALAIGRYRPGRKLGRITTPTLIAMCDPDTVAPNRVTARHVRRAANPRITTRTYACGHFEIYHDAWFETAVGDQVEFLLATLGMPTRTNLLEGVF